MSYLDHRTPTGAVVWTVGTIIVGAAFRIGWEVGGAIWVLL